MSLRRRIECLEAQMPALRPKVVLDWVCGGPSPDLELPPATWLVEDVFRRDSLGDFLEHRLVRRRLTTDPDDTGRICEPNGELAEVMAEMGLARDR